MSSWLLYPFTLGLVAAVNPCGFPLLPVYLSLFIEGPEADRQSSITRVRRGLSAGIYATVGFVVLFGALGILSEEGFSQVASISASWARYPMAILGLILAIYGAMTIVGKVRSFHLPTIRPGLAQRRPLAIALFGISYGVASLGCSLPLFLGGVASGFSHHGVLRGIEVFVAYAVGMGLLLTIVALVMSLTEVATAQRLRAFSPFVRPIGGLVLLLVGLYLAVYWVMVIIDPTSSTAVSRSVEQFQSQVGAFLQLHASLLGAIFGVVLVAGFLILFLLDRSHQNISRQSVKG